MRKYKPVGMSFVSSLISGVHLPTWVPTNLHLDHPSVTCPFSLDQDS